MTDDWRTKMKKLWTKGKTGAAAVLLAVLLAWEADVDERGRMAAFFTVLGDALALLALQPSCPAAEDEVTPCPA